MAPVAGPHDETLPVAVFDSGVGGLTVLHECLVSLPARGLPLPGDTARFPYGDRAPEELLGFARELAGILLERGAKLLVVACNSATAAALPALRKELERRVPVVGVVATGVAPGRGGHPQRARRADRHARHGARAAPTPAPSPRPRRGPSSTRVASAELAPLIQEGGEVDHRVARLRRGRLPAAQARRAWTR